MKHRLAALTVLALAALDPAHADQAALGPAPKFDLGAVAPALQGYTETVIEGDLWKRPDLAPATAASPLFRRSLPPDKWGPSKPS